MNIDIQSIGLEAAFNRLNISERTLASTRTNALNRAATRIRRQIVDEIRQPTGLKRKTVNAGIAIHRAGTQRDYALIIPESQGIPVSAYRYTFQPVGSAPTRARILVGWPGGQKIAAGFINPRGRQRAPLRTRSHRGPMPRPRPAIGPSIAAAFREVVTPTAIDQYQERVAEELRRGLERLITQRR